MRRSAAFPILLVVSFVFASCVRSFAQSPFEAKKLDKEIDLELRTQDVGKLANDLFRARRTSVREQLKAMNIYARAGHRDRVLDSIVQLSTVIPSLEYDDRFSVTQTIRNAVDNDDLSMRRLFYERISVNGDENTSEFVKLWQEFGDIRELEKWLAPRAKGNERWWELWFEIRAKLGTADALIDEMESDARAHPGDQYRLQKYLQRAGTRDITWLLQAYPSESSFEAYELASVVGPYSKEMAIGLLERSLSLPFTAVDRKDFDERAFRTASIAPDIKDPEKQLRYWTLKNLARLYNEAGRPHQAQPFAERLTAMDTSGIQKSDSFNLAGAVQAASGTRVVESRILQDEATNQQSPQYWLDRANYYRGRNDPDAVWATFKQALEIFRYKPDDRNSNDKRIIVIDAFTRWAEGSKKDEVASFLRNELNLKTDANYQFDLSHIISIEFDEIIDEYYTNNSRLAELLATREEWGSSEAYFIEEVFENDGWKSDLRTSVAKELSALARRNLKSRAMSFANACVDMYPSDVPRVLEALLPITQREGSDTWDASRVAVENMLFKLYLKSGKWREAERLFGEKTGDFEEGLGSIAIASAKRGDIKDAVRLWTIQANLDRRKLEGLDTLSRTGARPLLKTLYQDMKKRDPLSYIPDRALSLLN